MTAFIDFFLHVDEHLADVISRYGWSTHVLLFAVIFFETGVVVTPFLPGDSLLFAAGTFAATGALDLTTLLVTLFAAAVLGDALNYRIGRIAGKRIIDRGSLFGLPVNRQHIDRTSGFFARHGHKAIVFARFMPIVRTFAPFVAGAAGMEYRRFAFYNVAGGALWVGSFTLTGYFFGNIPAVRENFAHVILAIIVISVIPPALEFLRGAKDTAPAVPGEGRQPAAAVRPDAKPPSAE